MWRIHVVAQNVLSEISYVGMRIEIKRNIKIMFHEAFNILVQKSACKCDDNIVLVSASQKVKFRKNVLNVYPFIVNDVNIGEYLHNIDILYICTL